MEIFLELAKAWGPPGLLAMVLWWQLDKAEKREAEHRTFALTREGTLGARIQLLENKLMENYDERIEAANQQTTALLTSAQSTKELIKVVEKLQEAIMKRIR